MSLRKELSPIVCFFSFTSWWETLSPLNIVNHNYIKNGNSDWRKGRKFEAQNTQEGKGKKAYLCNIPLENFGW